MTSNINAATMDDSSTNIKELFQMNNADDLDSLVSQLSAKEKAELVQKLLGIGDKLRLPVSCQAGLGDKSRGGLARFGRGNLTIPKS